MTPFFKLLPSQVTRDPVSGSRDGWYSISFLHSSRAKLPSSKTSITLSDGLYFRVGWQQKGIGFRNSHLAFATVCPLPCPASSWLSHNLSGHSSRTSCPNQTGLLCTGEAESSQKASGDPFRLFVEGFAAEHRDVLRAYYVLDTWQIH